MICKFIVLCHTQKQCLQLQLIITDNYDWGVQKTMTVLLLLIIRTYIAGLSTHWTTKHCHSDLGYMALNGSRETIFPVHQLPSMKL